MHYFEELTRAIEMLAGDPRVVFLGQAVAFPGTGMTRQFTNVQRDKLIELPVCEELQLGISLGMAIDGAIPVSVYPRWNFLLLAANQLVNHLDKWPLMTGTGPRVIIKVGVGSERPLFPGHQHVGDFSAGFRAICQSLDIIELKAAEQIMPAYELALQRDDGRSTVLVEYADLYS